MKIGFPYNSIGLVIVGVLELIHRDNNTLRIAIKERKMNWCAACGNPRVIIENDKDGYSFKKGLVGTALMGPMGAVAGVAGKEVTVYYCPKCGARLHNCMPEYEVSYILDLLKDAKTSSASKVALYREKDKYPNMLWPEELDRVLGEQPNSKVREDNADSSIIIHSIKKFEGEIDGNIFSGDVEKDIKEYLNKTNAPVRYSEIKDSFRKSSYSEKLIIDGILDLIEKGLIKYHGEYFALVRDLDEMVQLAKSGNDNRKQLEEELFCFKKDLERKEHEEKEKQSSRITEVLSCRYKMQLLLCKGKAQECLYLCKNAQDEINKAELNKGEEIRKIQQVIQDLTTSSDNNFEDAINSIDAAIKEKESEMNNLSILHMSRKRALRGEIEALTHKKSKVQTEQIEKENAKKKIPYLQSKITDIENRVADENETKREFIENQKRLQEKWNFEAKAIEEQIEQLGQGSFKKTDYNDAKRQLEELERPDRIEIPYLVADSLALFLTRDEIKYRIFCILDDSEKPITLSQLLQRMNCSKDGPQYYGAILGQMIKGKLIKRIKIDEQMCYTTAYIKG